MASNNYGGRGGGGGAWGRGGGAWGRGARGGGGTHGGGDNNGGGRPRFDSPSNSVAGAAVPAAPAAGPPPPMNRPAPEGRRGVRRPRHFPTPEERNDVVASKPANYFKSPGKTGVSGRPVDLLVNYFTLTKRTDWCIYNYRVDFKPEEETTQTKKYLLRQHGAVIGPYIFDGSTLYTANRLHPDPMLLYSTRERTGDRFELSVRLIQELDPGDVATIQFFNITLRKSLSAMGLEQVDRHFFDRQKAFRLEGRNALEIWPGFKTTMRNHEHNVLLCVEVAHKVFRLDTVLQTMQNLCSGSWRNPDEQAKLREGLVGQVVMTSYNGKTYKIDDIRWDATAASGFEQTVNGVATQVSYVDYYRTRYNKTITQQDQPLLVSRRSKRDIHRGLQGDILLIPELCQMTGLDDSLRKNIGLMRDLADRTNLSPQARVERIEGFMRRLKGTPEVREDLQRWGLNFSDNLVDVKGRVIPQETILFQGGEHPENPRSKADWTEAFRRQKLLQTPQLVNWIAVVSGRDRGGLENLLGIMKRVATPLGFQIANPLEVITISNINPQTYSSEIQKGIDKYRSRDLQMVFVVLANDRPETYSAVKRKCTNEHGIASQCFLAKHFDPRKARGLMSVATKVVVQMSAKLGGVPWSVKNPINDKIMILGFDVHHCGRRVGRSVGALVATTTHNFGGYYSAVSFHENREEVSSNICQDLTKCLHAFQKANDDALPNRIIMYRDGVGEGQLSYVYNTELDQIKTSLKLTYDGAKRPLPKFSFIVVTKRINTRIFTAKPKIFNPDPGTVVDDQITLPERYDFFLISQNAKQGTTVSPTSYNVLFDQQGVPPDTIQKLTYRLCHLYYNWSGTVAVPAPVQYAHRLAFQSGTSLDRPPNEALSHKLHFL